MQAWQIKPAAADGKLAKVSLPEPEPGPGEVVVRMRAASFNYRDLLVADNVYRSKATALIPLSDGAGEIAKVGDGVSRHRPGDRVAGAFYPDWIRGSISESARARSPGATVDGVLAEYVRLPAHAAIGVPDHLSFEEAATLPCAALTAWNALVETGRTKASDTVLLQGSGGVSMMALAMARMMGARVIHMSSDEGRCRRLRELGVDCVIDYKAKPDWDREVMAMTEDRGVDLVVEVGGPATLARSMRAVRVGGTIVSVGFVGGGGTVDPRPIISRAIRLVGITVGSCDMFEAMNRAILQARLRPVIDRTIGFEDAAEGYRQLRAGGHFGKLVVTI
ncbi:MAG: NAD(P)-dependent alcohol dehydrogenase [Rhizobiaceae bacterium]|nr:NAD(P)-dependent alcohol dehydrogenase [Rhizobiaceae bacterium]MCV0404944.1 NAD(P)-dependent alcohol dehydrogenase [Rhizobiaceae bacterium]